MNELPPPFEVNIGNAPYVFVSYAHKNKELVYPIIEKLHQKGVNIWYDEGIPPKSNWIQMIANKLKNCSIFLVFITPQILNSENVKDEIAFAKKINKPIFPIYVKETRLPVDIDFQIHRYQALFKYKMDEDLFWKKVETHLAEVTDLDTLKADAIQEPESLQSDDLERILVNKYGIALDEVDLILKEINEAKINLDQAQVILEIERKFDLKILIYNEDKEIPKGRYNPLFNLHAVKNSQGNIIALKLFLAHVYELPESIGNLSDLKSIDLAMNYLERLPKSFNNLKSLQRLTLMKNKFAEFPQNLLNLFSLEFLNLSDNYLSHLPSKIDSLQALQELIVDNNLLTSLPATLLNLPHLKRVIIHNNPLDEEAQQILAQLNAKGVETFFNKDRVDCLKLVNKRFPDLPYYEIHEIISNYNFPKMTSEKTRAKYEKKVEKYLNNVEQEINSGKWLYNCFPPRHWAMSEELSQDDAESLAKLGIKYARDLAKEDPTELAKKLGKPQALVAEWVSGAYKHDLYQKFDSLGGPRDAKLKMETVNRIASLPLERREDEIKKFYDLSGITKVGNLGA